MDYNDKKASLRARTLYNKFLEGTIDYKEIIDNLIVLIENSDSDLVRINSIEIIEEIGVINKAVYDKLKDFLISDENIQVRVVTARILVKYEQKETLELFKWVVQNETYVSVVNTLIESYREQDKLTYNILKNKISKRYSRLFSIKREEAGFFWDFDVLRAESNNNLEIDNKFFAIYRYSKEFPRNPLISVFSNPFPSLAVVKGHVIALNIKNFKIEKVPDSIVLLSKLKYINLSFNNLTEIPASIGILHRITHIDLSDNNLTSLPDSIQNLYRLKWIKLSFNLFIDIPYVVLKSVKYQIAKKYIKEGVTKSEASILGLIEILSGLSLYNIDNPEKYKEFGNDREEIDDKYPNFGNFKESMLSQYKIDDKGHIVEIYTSSFQGNSFEKIPKEIKRGIEKLKYFERLFLNSYQIYERK